MVNWTFETANFLAFPAISIDFLLRMLKATSDSDRGRRSKSSKLDLQSFFNGNEFMGLWDFASLVSPLTSCAEELLAFLAMFLCFLLFAYPAFDVVWIKVLLVDWGRGRSQEVGCEVVWLEWRRSGRRRRSWRSGRSGSQRNFKGSSALRTLEGRLTYVRMKTKDKDELNCEESKNSKEWKIVFKSVFTQLD